MIFIASLLSLAQAVYWDAPSSCWNRFAFPYADVVETNDITYGNSFDFASDRDHDGVTGENRTLIMDCITPPASDSRTQRPAVVFVHGGAFHTNLRDRVRDEGRHLGSRLASWGLIQCDITYRQGAKSGNRAWRNWEERVAVQDVRSAVRYLRTYGVSNGCRTSGAPADCVELKVDPARIALSGSSAGAKTIMYYAYKTSLHHEYWSGNSADHMASTSKMWMRRGDLASEVQGIVPISGSMDSRWGCEWVPGTDIAGFPPFATGEAVHPNPQCHGMSGGSISEDYSHQAGSISDDGVHFSTPSLIIHGYDDLMIPYEGGLAVNTQLRNNMKAWCTDHCPSGTPSNSRDTHWDEIINHGGDCSLFQCQTLVDDRHAVFVAIDGGTHEPFADILDCPPSYERRADCPVTVGVHMRKIYEFLFYSLKLANADCPGSQDSRGGRHAENLFV